MAWLLPPGLFSKIAICMAIYLENIDIFYRAKRNYTLLPGKRQRKLPRKNRLWIRAWKKGLEKSEKTGNASDIQFLIIWPVSVSVPEKCCNINLSVLIIFPHPWFF
jgi:hypothetical protein